MTYNVLSGTLSLYTTTTNLDNKLTLYFSIIIRQKCIGLLFCTAL